MKSKVLLIILCGMFLLGEIPNLREYAEKLCYPAMFYAVDEIGKKEDVEAIQEVLHCGVKLVATAHGYDFVDICQRLGGLTDVFERYLILSNRKGTGTLEAILDKEGKIIRKGDKE